MDLFKVFDCALHHPLIEKLEAHNISAILLADLYCNFIFQREKNLSKV